jgi:hypothetical protein
MECIAIFQTALIWICKIRVWLLTGLKLGCVKEATALRQKKFEGDFLDQDKIFLTTTKILRTLGITSIIAVADLF